MTSELFSPMLATAQQSGILRDDVPVKWLTDWVFRALSSFIFVPESAIATDNKMQLRQYLEAWILPALMET
jgi:hypothetical protein